MKRILLIALLAMSCGGKLTDEERKRLHEGMATQDIKRVSDAELQEAAIAYGRSVLADVERIDPFLRVQSRIDSLARARHVLIYSLMPDAASLKEIEKQLVDAYLSGSDAGQVSENLQRIGEDSLLFTKPVFKDRVDGSQEFSHAIGIKMAKKTIILSIPAP